MEKILKPKIVVSSYDDLKNPYYGGGGAIAIHEVFKRLTSIFEVTVLTGKYPQSKDEVIEKITYRRIGTGLFGPKIGQLVFNLLLPIYVLTQKFDLWVESFTPPFSTACLQLFSTRPVVGLIHMLSGRDMMRKYKIPFHLVEELGLKTYKYFIGLSDSTKNEIVKFNKKASVLIAPNGFSIPAQAVDYQRRNKNYIVFIGRIEVNQKGLDLLIEAISQLKNGHQFLKNQARSPIKIPKLKIAGGGEAEEIKRLHTLIDSKGVSDCVELVGRVDGQSKHDLFQEALFVIIPSRFETFSISALETLSYGIPLIVFDIEGLKWIPENDAVKVSPFNTDKLSQSILKVIQNTKLRNKLSQNGLKLARKYNWDKTSLDYKEFFERILKE